MNHLNVIFPGFSRQLAAFVDAPHGDERLQLFEKLVQFLEGHEELKLQRSSFAQHASSDESHITRVVYWDQGNAKVSRKILEPILSQQFFASL